MDWFSPIDPSKKNSEFIAVESKSFWKAAWGRFKKNPMAVLGLVVIRSRPLILWIRRSVAVLMRIRR